MAVPQLNLGGIDPQSYLSQCDSDRSFITSFAVVCDTEAMSPALSYLASLFNLYRDGWVESESAANDYAVSIADIGIIALDEIDGREAEFYSYIDREYQVRLATATTAFTVTGPTPVVKQMTLGNFIAENRNDATFIKPGAVLTFHEAGRSYDAVVRSIIDPELGTVELVFGYYIPAGAILDVPAFTVDTIIDIGFDAIPDCLESCGITGCTTPPPPCCNRVIVQRATECLSWCKAWNTIKQRGDAPVSRNSLIIMSYFNSFKNKLLSMFFDGREAVTYENGNPNGNYYSAGLEGMVSEVHYIDPTCPENIFDVVEDYSKTFIKDLTGNIRDTRLAVGFCDESFKRSLRQGMKNLNVEATFNLSELKGTSNELFYFWLRQFDVIGVTINNLRVVFLVEPYMTDRKPFQCFIFHNGLVRAVTTKYTETETPLSGMSMGGKTITQTQSYGGLFTDITPVGSIGIGSSCPSQIETEINLGFFSICDLVWKLVIADVDSCTGIVTKTAEENYPENNNYL